MGSSSNLSGLGTGAPSRPTKDAPERVLFVVNTLPPHDLSGAGEQAVQLKEGLLEHGVGVEIAGRGLGGARGPKVLFPLLCIFPVLRLLVGGGIEVIQIHESDGGLLAVCLRVMQLPLLRRWLPPVRLVALLQVSYDEEAKAVRSLRDAKLGKVGNPTHSELRFKYFRTPVQRILGRLSARLADVVLVPSEQTGREIARDYGGPSPVVVPNATASTSVSPVPSDKRGDVLLFVGRLRIRKGVEILLWSLARLRESGIAVQLRIAGDGERLEHLIALVEKLNLQDCVKFLGRQSRDQLRCELAMATALVVPSTYEGMPLVILEAMEEQVPVVASAVSGIPEIVTDGESGWLVPPENVEALSQVLSEVLSDPAECRRRGAAGKVRLQQYRPEVVAERWIRAVLG